MFKNDTSIFKVNRTSTRQSCLRGAGKYKSSIQSLTVIPMTITINKTQIIIRSKINLKSNCKNEVLQIDNVWNMYR